MKLKSGLCVIVSLVACSDSAIAGVLTGPVINPANGHSYYLLEQDTWTNSEAFAQTLGGHLVTINDQAENEWVFDAFASFDGTDRNLWIGLNDAADEGTFVWSSGETATYRNWAINKPDGSSTSEPANYVSMISPATSFPDGVWDDARDLAFDGRTPSNPYHGVVEVVPEPASLILLSLGALSTLQRKRREQ